MVRWIAAFILVVACSSGGSGGGGGGSAPPGNTAAPPTPSKSTSQAPEDRVRARISEMHAACAAGQTEAVIGMLAYRGDDEARKWKSAMRPDDEHARDAATELCRHMGSAAPKMTAFESETESEGTWLIGMVEMGGGTAAFAFLDVGGVLLLGDID
jgi:hypothetical protein